MASHWQQLHHGHPPAHRQRGTPQIEQHRTIPSLSPQAPGRIKARRALPQLSPPRRASSEAARRPAAAQTVNGGRSPCHRQIPTPRLADRIDQQGRWRKADGMLCPWAQASWRAGAAGRHQLLGIAAWGCSAPLPDPLPQRSAVSRHSTAGRSRWHEGRGGFEDHPQAPAAPAVAQARPSTRLPSAFQHADLSSSQSSSLTAFSTRARAMPPAAAGRRRSLAGQRFSKDSAGSAHRLKPLRASAGLAAAARPMDQHGSAPLRPRPLAV